MINKFRIKKAVESYADLNGLKKKDIAVMLFPESKPTTAAQILGRVLSGHLLHKINPHNILHICEVLEVSPNYLFGYE